MLSKCRGSVCIRLRNREIIDPQRSNLSSVLSDFQRLEDYQRRLDTSNLKLSEYPNVEELRVRDGLLDSVGEGEGGMIWENGINV